MLSRPPQNKIAFRVEQEQILRESIFWLTPRCAQMIRMLFVELLPRHYQEIAKEPNLTIGSIGLICGPRLDQLK